MYFCASVCFHFLFIFCLLLFLTFLPYQKAFLICCCYLSLVALVLPSSALAKCVCHLPNGYVYVFNTRIFYFSSLVCLCVPQRIELKGNATKIAESVGKRSSLQTSVPKCTKLKQNKKRQVAKIWLFITKWTVPVNRVESIKVRALLHNLLLLLLLFSVKQN